MDHWTSHRAGLWDLRESAEGSGSAGALGWERATEVRAAHKLKATQRWYPEVQR